MTTRFSQYRSTSRRKLDRCSENRAGDKQVSRARVQGARLPSRFLPGSYVGSVFPHDSPMTPLIYCFYRNSTSDTQVVRIRNVPNFHFERVVRPGHDLIFRAPAEGELEVYTGMLTSIRLATIPCDCLHP